MSAQHRIHTIHGHFEHLTPGERVEKTAEQRTIAAVVRGHLTLRVAQEEVVLRASDAATIPARSSYVIEAMEDSLMYQYEEPAEESLWGV